MINESLSGGTSRGESSPWREDPSALLNDSYQAAVKWSCVDSRVRRGRARVKMRIASWLARIASTWRESLFLKEVWSLETKYVTLEKEARIIWSLESISWRLDCWNERNDPASFFIASLLSFEDCDTCPTACWSSLICFDEARPKKFPISPMKSVKDLRDLKPLLADTTFRTESSLIRRTSSSHLLIWSWIAEQTARWNGAVDLGQENWILG